MSNILEIKNTNFSYPDKKDVLSDISLNFCLRDKVALIGPNGSGKTTLFMLICGILPLGAGQILFNSKPVKYKSFNSSIAYLFQSPDDQLFSPSVFDDVAFGPLNMNMSDEEVDDMVKKALYKVGLKGVEDKMPHHLSGGQKRLAALASLLSMEPDLLLLDEPASNLDAGNRRKVVNIVRKLDRTLLIASHDLEFLLETCNRCIILDEGKLVADGPIKDIMANEQLLNAHGMEKPHSLIPHTHKGNIIKNPGSH